MSDNDCCNGDIPTEEPLADWERELLKPDPNMIIHMYPAEGMSACEIKLDDGKTHAVNSNIQVVSCGDCRMNYLTYVNDQLKNEIRKEKEATRVANQATTMVRRELRNATLRVGHQQRELQKLREDLDYVVRRSGITPPNTRYDAPRYYPVERYPY